MTKVAILLRFAQFYAHIAHNLVSGYTFFEDHEFFGTLYKDYESAYDSVVERMIGLGEKVDLFKLQPQACEMLGKVKFTNTKQAIQELLKIEKALVSTVETEIKGKSQGTIQLLGDIANFSEMRQYKMNQKIK